MVGSVKDLYMGKSLHELNQQAADIQYEKTVISLKKVFCGAQGSFIYGDEERAYIMYTNCLDIIAAIQTTAEYKNNLNFFEKYIGKTNLNVAVTNIKEFLAANLKKRYEAVSNLTSREDVSKPEASGSGSNVLKGGS